ncbi:ketopantoate reductase PanE/ApbA C terminal-domain-containing protein [Fimicolochytrium jonesii]|uniref:ketopantoate reductase PanE/ApbA C terminal-domain-containing protein n=1 Tax=Fimicolochytrium jonesii TaxID=1396493 RepID=UPI0022FF21C7|nr:ketopantoate reductase PanE/ApbA C terminal-domain-containing protein [Fimicolochytrium jonesii]KAI8826580.1 ketopantoate reductase PanE/ApbA C terminal-domain-containing protein [Fimicolochytrium jonesii]
MPPPRIHILGAGAIGLLHTHILAQHNVPTTLLLRPATLQSFLKAGSIIRVHDAADDSTVEHTGIQAEDVAANGKEGKGGIDCLLVCTKAGDTHAAVQSIRHRLIRPRSISHPAIIILLQNGVLALHPTIQSLFPPTSHGGPVVFAGSTTHGAWMRDRFNVVWAGRGGTCFGPISGSPASISDTTGGILTTLNRAGLEYQPPDALLPTLLLKLVTNACLNPITALLGLPNGCVLTPLGRGLITQICTELASLLPHLHAPASQKWSAEMLTDYVCGVADATKGNRNSMLVDVERGGCTEVDFILGYCVTKGEEYGVQTPVLRALWDLVRLKSGDVGV